MRRGEEGKKGDEKEKVPILQMTQNKCQNKRRNKLYK